MFLNTTASVWTIFDYFSLNGDNLNMQVNQCDAERYEIDLFLTLICCFGIVTLSLNEELCLSVFKSNTLRFRILVKV